ncbi:uncharacterized mitochondrial protein AtMg00310-like [Rutidosis leptorrhynchoides]|uniref:uncharacterized mitochondrial protein AtMg00310-like n=1 Tax=Rutidosis leptorrhynchoides TaxID=125765 RepID=UPI003A99D48D
MCRSKKLGGLGMRDLTAFNSALLAKQGWRIIQDPSSLLARSLKDKYFPHCRFLDAEIGRNPSYTWRCLLEGREVLSKGGIWRVGDGTNINISDNWLMDSVPVAVSPSWNGRVDRISQLLSMDRREWNFPFDKEGLQSCFSFRYQ